MTCTLHVAWDGGWPAMTSVPAPDGADPGQADDRACPGLRPARQRRGLGRGPARPPTPSLSWSTTRATSRWCGGRAGAPGPRAGPDRRVLLMYGLGTEDDPVFAGMHEASALVAGATLAAARAVWTGAAQHGASIAGGLHHAMRGNASGFCVYNDPAIAIAWLLRPGRRADRLRRRRRPSRRRGAGGVLGRSAGADDQPARASGDAVPRHRPCRPRPAGRRPKGSAVNVALPAGTRDAGWLRAFHAVVPPLLREFRPADPGQPARLRHALERSAGQPGADHRRAARRARRDPRARARGGRRPLAAYRRRRLRAGPGRAQDLDASARRGRGPADRPGRAEPRPLARVRRTGVPASRRPSS